MFQEIIIIFCILGISLYYYYNKDKKIHLLIALLFSLVLVYFAKYNYKNLNYFLLGLNLFPLFAWTFGLLIIRKGYDLMKYPYKFFIITGIYWILLISCEYIGYHFMGIQLTSNYPGLLGMDLMHAPTWQKAAYLLMGPLYLFTTIKIDEIKISHKKKVKRKKRN